MWNLNLEDDKDFVEEYDRVENLIKQTAAQGNLQAMFDLGKNFDPKEEYWDLDTQYRYEIEKMENYPPVELFEDDSNNSVFRNLRYRAYSSQVFISTPLLPVLSKNMQSIFDNLNQEKFPLIDTKTAFSLNPHEARVVLEMLNMIGLSLISEKSPTTIEILLGQL